MAWKKGAKRNSPSAQPHYKFADHIKRQYGMTPDDYIQKLNEQGGACAICRHVFPSLVIDHDHDTGEVRGLLCHKCNVGMGHFNDNIELLSHAVIYLAQHSGAVRDGS